MEALNDAYYRELKGSVGARAFYEWFKRNNARQRKSLEDKGKETGKKRKVPEQFRKDMEERRRKREADGTARREKMYVFHINNVESGPPVLHHHYHLFLSPVVDLSIICNIPTYRMKPSPNTPQLQVELA
jgi:hypothetical protein